MVVKKRQTTQHIEYIHPLALHKHLARHFHKHAHHYVHIARHLHHAWMHLGELMIILCIGFSGLIHANFSGSLEAIQRDNMADVETHLLQAIQHPEDIATNGNLISVRTVDENVYNTFATGYCTYGAALISPEFFPYTTPMTQQRTWGGNAADWCANASATGYQIGSTPVQGALIVYGAGGKFGSYGHVGKVMHYDKTLNKIIVRDMARASIGVMTDRWDDAGNSSIECYIYNSKSAISTTVTTGTTTTTTTTTTIPPTTPIPTTTTTTTTLPTTTTTIPTTITTTTPTSSTITHTTTTTPITTTTPVNNSHPAAGTGTTTPKSRLPDGQAQTTTQTSTTSTSITSTTTITPTAPVQSQTTTTEQIALDFSGISDLGKQIVSQWDIQAAMVNKKPMHVGDEDVLTITIKDKKTGENISALLPLAFDFINSNDNIGIDYSFIQLVYDGKIQVHIDALQKGSASLVVNFGDDKIAKIGFTIQ